MLNLQLRLAFKLQFVCFYQMCTGVCHGDFRVEI